MKKQENKNEKRKGTKTVVEGLYFKGR